MRTMAMVSMLTALSLTIAEARADNVHSVNDTLLEVGPDCRISVTQLINERKQFDGQPVIVEGYIVYGFERSAVYPTKEFADHFQNSSAISLVLPGYRFQKDPEVLPQARYGIIKGTFRDTRNKSGPFIAAIENIDLAYLELVGRKDRKRQPAVEK